MPKEEEELEEPTCVFSGMIWQGASIDGLGYFIEGEEKGDFITVFLPNGGRSRKYAYYGDPPLTFYREMEVEEKDDDENPKKPPTPEKDDEPDKPKKKKIVYLPITSCDFERAWKEIFLFFFVSEESDPAYQARAINFNTTHFPAGNFWFFSRCEQPLSIKFGLDEGQLPPNGQAMIKARLDEFGDLPIRVFKPKGGTSRKVYSTIWNHNPRTRTLVFFLPKPNGVNVRRIVDVVQEEKALGLRPPKDDDKKKKDPFREPDN
ncbi:MAG: hypothetical protein VCA36_07135 [Opitutales bacterium]